MTSFARAGSMLGELAGIRIGAKQVERHAEALGRDVARDGREAVEPGAPAADTLHMGLDGTGLPVRRGEAEGRAGKRADGSAKTREAKLAAVWSAERLDADGAPRRDPGSASFNAAIESIAGRDADPDPAPFAQRALREVERRGFQQAERRVALGDGAAWIWNFADEHLPGAVQIVDLFHAKEHLFDAAKAIYGTTSDLADQWGRARRDELDRHGPAPSSTSCAATPATAKRPAASWSASPPTDSGWTTPPSENRACASPPASSRAPASPSSAADSSAAACTGPSTAPTPSSHSAAPSTATASTATGNGGPHNHDASCHKSDVHPALDRRNLAKPRWSRSHCRLDLFGCLSPVVLLRWTRRASTGLNLQAAGDSRSTFISSTCCIACARS